MKKIPILLLALALLALCACTAELPADTPPASAPVETVPAETAPAEDTTPPAETAPAEDTAPPPETEPADGPEFPEYLQRFSFYSISMYYPTSAASTELYFEELDSFKALLNMESWTTPPEVPAMGLNANWMLYDYSGNSLTIVPWDEETCLILTKTGPDLSTGYLYSAPLSVYTACDAYISEKFAANFTSFSELHIESCEINGALAEDGFYYLDHSVYLFDEEQSAALSALLDAAERTDIAGEWLGGHSESLYMFYSPNGDRVDVEYAGDYCLIDCFPAEGGAFRSFGPLSLLDQIAEFMEGVSPLGMVDNTAERYFDLFRQDSGINALVAMSTEDGSFTEEQIALYTMLRVSDYPFDFPNSTAAYDAVTTRQFGLTIPNFNVPATDFHFGTYLVLEEESVDESGIITARFQCYLVPESYWLDELLPQWKLTHIKELLLTGNDGDFPEPFPVEIVFEEKYDYTGEAPMSYVFYHSLKTFEP